MPGGIEVLECGVGRPHQAAGESLKAPRRTCRNLRPLGGEGCLPWATEDDHTKWLIGTESWRLRHLPQNLSTLHSVIDDPGAHQGVVIRDALGMPRGDHRAHHFHAPNVRNLTRPAASVLPPKLLRRTCRRARSMFTCARNCGSAPRRMARGWRTPRAGMAQRWPRPDTG